MSRSAESEKDLRRIDRALERVFEVLDEEIPGPDAQPNIVHLARDSRLKAADRVVALLERRSKLLGLDATSESKDAPQPGQTPVDRILAAVPKPVAKAGT